MLFMVIERFGHRDAKAVYRNQRDEGRSLPDGLRQVGSWIEANVDRCFQVTERDDALMLQDRVPGCGDLVTFEIGPVAASSHPPALVERHLEPLACSDGEGADFEQSG